jgi:RHS repeat-associated protein
MRRLLITSTVFACIFVSAAPVFAQAQLSVNGVASPAATVAGAGSTVSIGITDGPGNATDWVGLYAAGAYDWNLLDYRFMNSTQTEPTTGHTSGTVSFPLPLTPGDYEFRFFANHTWERLAVSGIVTARYDAGFAINGVASPAATVARAGSIASISITNGPGTPTDWVGLYTAGTYDWNLLDYRFMNSTQTEPTVGHTSGTVSFPLPLAPGDYEFRFFANHTWQRIAVSGIVTLRYDTVLAVNGVVSPAATAARAGSTVSISITDGPGTTSDWVGLYAAGAGDWFDLDYRFMNSTQIEPATGQTSGTVSFPLPSTPGDYEFRFFAHHTWQRVAVTGIVTAVSDGIPGPPPAGTIAYYHTDAIGSVRMITNASGAEVARYDYLPFGEQWTATGIQDPRRFAGRERDQETSFDYFGARYFSSGFGRFTSPDEPSNDQSPGDSQSWNLYTYARNNPFRFFDPDGTTCVHTSGQKGETITTDDSDGKGCKELQEPTVVRGRAPLSAFDAVAIGAQRAQGPVNTIVAGASIGVGAVAVGAGALALAGGGLAAISEPTVVLGGMGGSMAGTISQIANSRLRDALSNLYQISDRMRGGTAAAVEFTRETGRLVGGSNHLLKAAERAAQLERILRVEALSTSERRLGEYALKQLRDALGSK